MKLPSWAPKLWVALAAAIALGMLESAWTGFDLDGGYRGMPTNTLLGVAAILIILWLVTWPYPWWIPGLAILEELTHWVFGYAGALPTLDTVLNHWSHAYLGFPLMPYLTFPLLSVLAHVFIMRALRTRGLAIGGTA